MARAFEGDIGPVRNHCHSVLNHAGKPQGHVPLFQLLRFRRRLGDYPGHSVPFDKAGVKLHSATLEGDWPQATRKQAQAIGVVIGCVVRHENKLASRQRNRLCGKPTIDADKGRLVVVVKAKPALRPGYNIQKCHQSPSRRQMSSMGVKP